MKHAYTPSLALVVLMVSAPARAAEPERSFGVAGKVGGGFGQAFGELGGTIVGELEFAYAPRWPAPIGRELAFTLSGRYTAPELAARGQADPRLPGDEAASYGIVQRQAAIGVGLLYRVPLGPAWVRPTVAAGVRTYLQRTELSVRAAGEAMGQWEETSTSVGGYGALGAEARVGPGAFLIEAVVGSAALDGAIFEDAQAGSVDVVAGYRWML